MEDLPLEELTKNITELSAIIKRTNSFKFLMFRGIVTGVGTFIGATVVVAIVIAILVQVLGFLGINLGINDYLQSLISNK